MVREVRVTSDVFDPNDSFSCDLSVLSNFEKRLNLYLYILWIWYDNLFLFGGFGSEKYIQYAQLDLRGIAAMRCVLPRCRGHQLRRGHVSTWTAFWCVGMCLPMCT